MAKLLKLSMKMQFFPYSLSNIRKRFKFNVHYSENQAQVFWNTHNVFLLNYQESNGFSDSQHYTSGRSWPKRPCFCCALAASQHQPVPGWCNSSMQPPPVPFSYMHSQQIPQQTCYLWRHFVSLVLRIHRNICIIHHSLLQETFFILHLKQGKKSDRL